MSGDDQPPYQTFEKYDDPEYSYNAYYTNYMYYYKYVLFMRVKLLLYSFLNHAYHSYYFNLLVLFVGWLESVGSI